MRRSVQKSAPPGQSGQLAENSSAGASQIQSASDLNHHESPKSRSGSRKYVAALGRKAGQKRCVLQLLKGALPRYQALGVSQVNPQPRDVNSQSFRRVLEF